MADRIRYAVSVPNHGEYADPKFLADLARQAEDTGWDGFFVWDHILFMKSYVGPFVDPFIALAGIAVATTRIRLGTLVTPLPRRRPWNVARQAVTLDHLSNGRLVLGVGLGYPADSEFEAFGEDGSPRLRARKLDEALEILAGLWRGEALSFRGSQFVLDDVTFLPTPVQTPRIPIWVGGYWPNKAPFRRAARWDGVFPGRLSLERRANWSPRMIDVGDFSEIVQFVKKHRESPAPMDYIIGGYTRGEGAEDEYVVRQYEDVGATWWIENLHEFRGTTSEMVMRLQKGPPSRSAG